jgi:hypothetical protein
MTTTRTTHRTPEPRPALRKAPDGSVHPAAAHLSSLAVELDPKDVQPVPTAGDRAGAKGKGKKGRKGGKGADGAVQDEVVELVVPLPKPVRRALRQRAAEYGWSAEEAAGHVLRVWAEH